MSLFLNKYRINSLRLNGYDYSREGVYFVTICVKDKKHLFGEVIQKNNSIFVELNELGKLAEKNFKEIEKFHPYTIVDQYLIMPNHIHGIIAILEQQIDHDDNKEKILTEYKNSFSPQRKNLPSIVRGYKASVKSYANKNNIDFNWQSGYYDRIIRNDAELINIQKYIFENPVKWTLEKDFPENLYR